MFNIYSRNAFRSLLKATILVCSIALPFTASAGLITINGSTLGDPTWNRPIGSGPNLSGNETAVAYDVILFQVDVSTTYDFLSTATTPASWDNYLFLYQNSFDSLNQLTNLIIGNDDFPAVGRSGFNGVALSTGVNYFAVTSGFGNDNAGDFTLNISSNLGTAFIPSMNDVPAPASLAILGLALFGTGILRRRKKV
jgi:hypothetical protein